MEPWGRRLLAEGLFQGLAGLGVLADRDLATGNTQGGCRRLGLGQQPITLLGLGIPAAVKELFRGGGLLLGHRWWRGEGQHGEAEQAEGERGERVTHDSRFRKGWNCRHPSLGDLLLW